MTPAVPPRRKIRRAFSSPMNGHRFNLSLECGHEIWVTRRQKPTIGRSIPCAECARGKETI